MTSLSYYSSKKVVVFLILLLLSSLLLIGCSPDLSSKTNPPNTNSTSPQLIIYLLQTNQIVFSEDDLLSYSPENKTFTFTEEGAKKMKAYQSSPLIHAGLYQKSFVIKLGEEELYRGKFWTALSSLIELGIVLSDVVMINEDYPLLTISSISLSDGDSPSNTIELDDSKLIEHFKRIHKLK